MRAAPGFTALAIVTIALGLGASAAVFSVLDPLLFRSLPVAHPEQLVHIHSTGSLQPIDIVEWRAFAALAADRSVLMGAIADGGARDTSIEVADGRSTRLSIEFPQTTSKLLLRRLPTAGCFHAMTN